MSIENVAIIGLGLLGGSIGLAVQDHAPGLITHGYDHDPDTRARAKERGLVSHVCDTAQAAVRDADLVILCVPVGAMESAAAKASTKAVTALRPWPDGCGPFAPMPNCCANGRSPLSLPKTVSECRRSLRCRAASWRNKSPR
ncbi:MAG: prephenate dehydrogenase/arogenate dehydrogenase family protein, partial [Erythrobacter sp.]|nr:prephenate dehydrogenase/arogenate dehydrogenase family protein [Erythrobacter sp.]